ncbi:MAG: DUF1015 domain-containing protein [Butyricicoccus sp.]|nr:DUF1015 domain-containing protein [Butyricicoccus sp.]
MQTHYARLPKILLPRTDVDLSKWAVVACDQYTSQPDYWEETDRLVGDAPSTLRLTLPEVYLEDADCSQRIDTIHQTMRQYLSDGILTEQPEGAVLLARDTGGPCPRCGLVLAFDLEAYDYTPGAASPIRPTEKTVVERIPPRLQVRKGAAIELPHIMLLIDDPDRSVIEPLYAQRAQFSQLYDVELMQHGGHLTGWFIPQGVQTDALLAALDHLADPAVFAAKYGLTQPLPVLPYAVGDGNHSMATAKAYWEEIKKDLTPAEQADHPARFVLAEVVNIHDESLTVEAIHRALFGVDAVDLLADAVTFFRAHGADATVLESAPHEVPNGAQTFPFRAGDRTGCLLVQDSPWALPVASLQAFLDDYLASHAEGRIDYIHGLDVLENLSRQPGNVGFSLPDPSKEDLFRGVILDGVLPRKTFSMGEAYEKRFYMEAKSIVPDASV